MKYFFSIILFLSVTVFTQELTYYDLTHLYSIRTNLKKCNSYLEKKRFTFLETFTDRSMQRYEYKGKNASPGEAYFYLSDNSVQLSSMKVKTFKYFERIIKNSGYKILNYELTSEGRPKVAYIKGKHLFILTNSIEPLYFHILYYQQ